MKKGFTLIELLAVIVILSIIALIATPIVINLIGKAREKSAENSVYGIIKSTENAYAINLVDGQANNKQYTCDGTKCVLTKLNNETYIGEEIKLEFNGIVPKSGIINLSKDGKVHIDNLEINDHICYEEKENIICKNKKKVNKLFFLDIPYKENMTYYFDFNEALNNKIENYSDGKTKLNIVNANIDNNSIYFTGENKSYAYTEKALSSHDYFTVYFVAKFDNVYSNNYLISTTSTNSLNQFGVGIGRYGQGTNAYNEVITMVSNVSNGAYTGQDILNYYVYAIVYSENTAYFYINGILVDTRNNCDSTSKFYFASYDNKGTIYGGSLIRFKQFAFVDAVHTESEVKSNSSWLYNKYLNN